MAGNSHFRRKSSSGQRPPPLPLGIELVGKDIDALEAHQVRKCLESLYPECKYGRRRWTPLTSGGWRFQHVLVDKILEGNLVERYPQLFGGQGEYTIRPFSPPVAAFCYAPKRVENNNLVDLIPGLFKANNAKKRRKGRKDKNKGRPRNGLILRKVLFSSDIARARAIREGATIEKFAIEFHVPFRNPCFRCYSFDHHTQECEAEEEICRRCSTAGHIQADCEHEFYCLHCEKEHSPARCWETKKKIRREEEEALLDSIPSFREVRSNPDVERPVELPWRQEKMCEAKHIDPEDFGSRTGEDFVFRKKKRKHRKSKRKPRSYAAALQRDWDSENEDEVENIDGREWLTSRKERNFGDQDLNARGFGLRRDQFYPGRQDQEVIKMLNELNKKVDALTQSTKEFSEFVGATNSRLSRIEKRLGISTPMIANAMEVDVEDFATQMNNTTSRIEEIERVVDIIMEGHDVLESKEEVADDNKVVQRWASRKTNKNKEGISQEATLINCNRCENNFTSMEEYENHECFLRSCIKCGYEAESAADQELHFRSEHQQVICQYCGQTGEGMRNLHLHFQQSHMDQVPQESSTPSKTHNNGHGGSQ